MSQPKKRVLLVDDDEEILEAMQIALAAHGYEVLLARDGSEALARAERDAPDVVVLDVVMPRRSGFAVLDRLRTGHSRTPRIVMVSGSHEPRYQEFAKSHGADAFLLKPFDFDRLLEKVDELLQCDDPAQPG